ncbi:EG45-like domain containing protein [Impatiens glandulifera]|uniref:EG45-like domain containing protein n=1 Tax=Impatiens glandulifera TaxID=253017 RepID=UPI001FB0727D|nr:EG45-like domain containing protein [Impatiens glandulifera]
MSKPPCYHHQWCFSLFIFTSLYPLFSQADVGSASHYNPPYTPTACFGSDGSQFPTNNMFAAAGEGIWDNGAACGRQYLVGCISTAAPSSCNAGQAIRVRIVDRAMTSNSRPSRDATIVLSTTAFYTITNGWPSIANIEFQQV